MKCHSHCRRNQEWEICRWIVDICVSMTYWTGVNVLLSLPLSIGFFKTLWGMVQAQSPQSTRVISIGLRILLPPLQSWFFENIQGEDPSTLVSSDESGIDYVPSTTSWERHEMGPAVQCRRNWHACLFRIWEDVWFGRRAQNRCEGSHE